MISSYQGFRTKNDNADFHMYQVTVEPNVVCESIIKSPKT